MNHQSEESFAPMPMEPTMELEMLFRTHKQQLLLRIQRYCTDEDAEEVLQDVFLRALEKIDSFRGESAGYTWLWRLTHRHCLNRLRNRKRREALFREHHQSLSWGSPVSPSNQDAAVILQEIWAQTDEESAHFAKQFYIGGMSHNEIATEAGCSRRTVGNRLQRFQKRITRFKEAKSRQ